MRRPRQPAPLLLSLRPRGQHAAVRAAAARRGAAVLALSPLRIEPRADAASVAALDAALACDLLLFTSPNAVRAAAALRPLRLRRGQRALAVGDGTRRALQRVGIAADAPARMDSEGLLGLPALADVRGRRVGLVTGAGGRNRLAPALRSRGASVLRADVYARVAGAVAPTRWQALAAALAEARPMVLLLSSGEALAALLAQVPPGLRPVLAGLPVAAASPRLAGAARAAGFERIQIAASARPAALLEAALRALG